MANIEGIPWRDAIDEALESNRRTGQKPDSLRALAGVLAGLDGSGQTFQSWQRTLKKIRAGEAVTEPTARLVARALPVPRKQLPPPQSQQAIVRLERHLAAIEVAVAEVLQNQREGLELLRGLRDSGARIQPATEEKKSE